MATPFPIPVTAAQVGTYFVGQYYQVLQHQPEFVHQFYSDASTMLRIDGNTRETATAMLQIHALVMSLSFTGIEIKTAHSLESWSGGVIVMVSGSVQIKDYSQRRKFMQTFFLAPQEKGFFVLNDIFHYVEEEPVHHHQAVLLAQENLSLNLNAPSSINMPDIQAREFVTANEVKENGVVENYGYSEQRMQQLRRAVTVNSFPLLSIAIPIFNITGMLSCQKYHLYFSCSLPLQSFCNPTSTISFPSSTIVNSQNPKGPDNQKLILRKQNSKSTAFLLHKLSYAEDNYHSLQSNPKPTDLQDSMPEEEKIKLLELSLVRKRTPQFPGSIYVQSPGDPDVGSSLPPLRTLFKEKADSDDDNDEDMIMRALEIRRKVTQEIFKEAMRKGKFGITYTNNLVNRLPGFIDYIMIEAASMKRLPQYSHTTFNLRAKTVIEDSQVVPLIRCLKHNSLSYHRISKVILMSRGNLGSIRRLVEWLKSVRVKGEFLGVALVNAGENILERSNEELDEIIEYLETKGVRMDWMGYVVSRSPQLLSYSLEEVKTRVNFYLDMGLNEHDFGTMVFDYPKVLGYFTMEEMNQKVNYLKEFGLKSEDVGRLLAFKPQLMGCSIEGEWKPLIKYLYYYGITRDGMRRMLTLKPMVFCIDLETTIVPKVKFFQDIGIRDDAIGNMLVKFPTLLTYSLHKKIRPVVIFLMTKAGVSEKDIAKVIAMGPELLGCSIVHKLEVNVKYYLSLGIRLKQLGEMIADFPMLLRYNIDVLRPKYSYLRRTMVRSLEDLIEFPRFLSYSLDGRIIPRHKVLVENQINLKLRYMLACTDDQFKKMVESRISKRSSFQSALMNDDITNPQT